MCSKGGEDVGESHNHSNVVLGGHCMHKDCVEVIDVGNKDVLHILEGACSECAREVYVHCARVEIGQGCKTEHIRATQISSVGMR